MWQLFALGALFFTAGENVADKAALVNHRSVDSDVASFYRPLLFFLVISAVGLSGWLGPLQFVFPLSIWLFTPVAMFASIFYTYLLKKIEVTSIGAAAYLAPFLFLFIDTHLLQTHFTALQILGILLLILGGIAFSLDGRTRRVKPELTWAVWAIFIFNLCYSGTEAYLFKSLNTSQGVNSPSFFASLWLLASLGLFLIVILKGKSHLLGHPSVRAYIPRVTLSKSFDAMSSLLWGQALIFATVSQVSAFDATFPLVLFVVVVVAQNLFGVNLKEKLDRDHVVWKAGAIILIVFGGLLAG